MHKQIQMVLVYMVMPWFYACKQTAHCGKYNNCDGRMFGGRIAQGKNGAQEPIGDCVGRYERRNQVEEGFDQVGWAL
ncbi:hypothetical protein SDJN03_21709, partial [Cucurbita argyrosperma subsp. sororia]